MNIVYASDDNYADILGVSLVSLFENNKECKELSVYILDDGIGGENKSRLLSVGEKYGRDISFLDVSRHFKKGMDPHHLSMTTFSRLYIGELLDDGIDKVLYLDCDIIVRKNIRELYDTDMEGLYAAGAGDCVSAAHRRAIGLGRECFYLNAGVLLANL